MIPGKMIKKTVLIALLIMLSCVFTWGNEGFKIGLIPEPRPTMTESRYVHLRLQRTIDADLGGGEYLFKPFSMAADSRKNLYIYDILQAKIFKFDKNLKMVKSFGRVGKKAGEFSGLNMIHPVFITIGGDGLLYARDSRKKKIIVFDTEGRFIREIPLTRYIKDEPVVDNTGAVVLPNVTRQSLDFTDEKEARLFSLPLENGLFDYLFFKPHKIDWYLHQDFSVVINSTLLYAAADSALLVYFQPSSTMLVVRNNTAADAILIRPKEAMAAHKKALTRELKTHPNRYRDLFSKLFVDRDNKDIYYLHMGRNMVKNINALYQFNLKGKLLTVYYVHLDESPGFTRFLLKQNGRFYAVDDDRVKIFTE